MLKLRRKNPIHTIRAKNIELGDVVVLHGLIGEVMFIARHDTKIELLVSAKANEMHLGWTYSGYLPNNTLIHAVRYK